MLNASKPLARSATLATLTLTLALLVPACAETPDRIGDAELAYGGACLGGGGGSCAAPLDPAKSLLITDPTVLANFSFQAALNQIVSTGTSGSGGPSSVGLYQQMMDTFSS